MLAGGRLVLYRLGARPAWFVRARTARISLMSQQHDLEAAATLFLGAPNDGERLQVRPDSHWFDRLADAVRFAIERMPSDRRWGTNIQTSTGFRIQWEEIVTLHKALAPPSDEVSEFPASDVAQLTPAEQDRIRLKVGAGPVPFISVTDLVGTTRHKMDFGDGRHWTMFYSAGGDPFRCEYAGVRFERLGDQIWVAAAAD